MSDFRDTLYTIDKKGNRRWVYNSVVRGFYRRKREMVVALLMAIYLLLPWISVGDTQAVLLNIHDRKFVFFGNVFWATDTHFLVMVLGALGISLFFFTAILGRVWCGWACPETVFLDFLFRPIEALIEGGPVQRARLDQQPWNFEKAIKKGLKYLVFAAVSWILASTALAYFVGREPLLQMMAHPPSENMYYFVLTLLLMGALLFQFGWFREQFCTIVCPYARFQSVLLDQNSLLVGYDTQRGEPRGKGKREDSSTLGDCIDCELCVKVCPTGIDIRNGLQLECVQCACCADACDSVMEKLGKAPGLVRYSTEEALAGRGVHVLRPRVVVYAALLVGYLVVFSYLIAVRPVSEFQVVRGARDVPYTLMPDGKVTNHLHVQISNKGSHADTYRVDVLEPKGIRAISPVKDFVIQPGEIGTLPLFLEFSPSILGSGTAHVVVSITSTGGFSGTQTLTVLGPG